MESIELPTVRLHGGEYQLKAPADELDVAALVEEWRNAKPGKYPRLRLAMIGLCWPEQGMAWGTLEDVDYDVMKFGKRVADALKLISPESTMQLTTKGDVCAAVLFRRLYPKARAKRIEGESAGAGSSPSSPASDGTDSATPTRTSD